MALEEKEVLHKSLLTRECSCGMQELILWVLIFIFSVMWSLFLLYQLAEVFDLTACSHSHMFTPIFEVKFSDMVLSLSYPS